MSDQELAGKRVLIREDLNAPVRDGAVVSDARIRAALPTLKLALGAGARVLVMSHLGRPEEGKADPAFSLQPVADCLAQALGQPVRLLRDWRGGGEDRTAPAPPSPAHAAKSAAGKIAPAAELAPGEIALLENVRFNRGETANDPALAQAYGALCDLFVMDAFGTAHRAHASTCGVIRYAPAACAGPLLLAELEGLEQALTNPARPLLAIVGGAKVSTKLRVLETLAEKVDQLVVGGGIANTFLAASGLPVGKSLHEPDLIPAAKALLDRGKPPPTHSTAGDALVSLAPLPFPHRRKRRGSDAPPPSAAIPLPVDVVVAKTLAAAAPAETKPAAEVAADDLILDIGPRSRAQLADLIAEAGTILWNGPVGAFEYPPFGGGTEALSRAIAASPAFSLAGGGDTLAAIDKFGIADKVSRLSTGGGAFLEYVEGKTLPAVAALRERAGT